jgi:hypothetical protein
MTVISGATYATAYLIWQILAELTACPLDFVKKFITLMEPGQKVAGSRALDKVASRSYLTARESGRTESS